MYKIVKQNGREVHLVVKPDKDCEEAMKSVARSVII
jgi:hypothetical protein